MSTIDLSHARWFKSSRSANNGSCVEATVLAEHVAVRDSKDVGGPVLVFGAGDWGAFLAGAKGGRLRG
ncbi:DUF397 domain-containing protein [Longispora fulva]|uniref:DUF397 domain-containing protein n=1 Tax=Longispora fulva TaxID=619741 RepID=UPI0018CA035C|nr:DUF397 domain-containing protein [Longispora fulva]GIG62765.1 DUF397 domain-containing protein [Longispora fulva]